MHGYESTMFGTFFLLMNDAKVRNCLKICNIGKRTSHIATTGSKQSSLHWSISSFDGPVGIFGFCTGNDRLEYDMVKKTSFRTKQNMIETLQ